MCESCRGLANVPGRDLAGASQTSLARTLLGTLPSGLHEDLHATSLHKDLHATTHAPLGLGIDIVDGVRALNLKGGGLVSASRAAPARILPGIRDPCRGSDCLMLYGYWLGSCLGRLVFRLQLPPSGLAAGAAATARAQVRGTKGPKL